MELRTFRAKTLPEAIDLVRRELGPHAAVLHTRELYTGMVSRLLFGRQVEIAATCDMLPRPATMLDSSANIPVPSHRDRYRRAAECANSLSLDELTSQRSVANQSPAGRSAVAFELMTLLLDADIDEPTARDLVAQFSSETSLYETSDRLRSVAMRLVTSRLRVGHGLTPGQQRARVAAFVGPTGVGKTTTIAKLAANHRLRERQRVGLITVDTFRVAAVEQLRTYADIIDLPMEVVANAEEMREAIHRLGDLDLVLIDTAGRTPRDHLQLGELRAVLQAAQPDDVLLVLSSTASARSLEHSVREFAALGTTSIVLTKIDELVSGGHLLGVLDRSGAPISYLTDGQSVPDDLELANPTRLAEVVLLAD